MNNFFQLIIMSTILIVSFLMVIVFVQILNIIHDFRQLIKKIEKIVDLPSFTKEAAAAAAVKVKQFFHKK